MKRIFIFLLAITTLSYAKIDFAFVTLGGGYPLGIINDLNSSFEKAYNDAIKVYGVSANETLTKTQGGSFSGNLIFSFSDSASVPGKLVFGGLAGYSYHGTGEAKWINNYQGNTLSVSGKYSINEIRVLPVLYKFNDENIGFGVGAGGLYSFVKYDQNNTNTIPDSPSLPSVSEKNSGLSWILWGMLRFQMVGLELAITGVNYFYIGAFICAP